MMRAPIVLFFRFMSINRQPVLPYACSMRRTLLSSQAAGLCAYLLLSLALLWKNGMYHPAALLLASAGFVCCCGMLLLPSKSNEKHPVLLAAVILAALLIAQSFLNPGIYLESERYDLLFWLLTFALGPIILCAYAVAGMRRTAVRRFVFIAALGIGVVFTLAMPIVSPDPLIDVFAMLQSSAAALLDGQNPYTTPVPDVYHGLNGPQLPGLVYPPAILWIITPVYGVLHDVRFAMIAGLIAALCAIWKLSGKTFALRAEPSDETAWSELLVLLLLWHPRGLFVIEQSWVDPLIAGLLGITLMLRMHRSAVSAGMYGLMVSLKQYLVFFIPIFFLLEKSRKKWLTAGLIAIFGILPFLLWDPVAFWNHGLLFQLTDKFRPDALTVPAFLWQFTGWEPGRGLSLAVGAIAVFVALPLTRRMSQPGGFLCAAAFIHYALFLLGSQGFANYYWLVCALLIFALAASSKKLGTAS